MRTSIEAWLTQWLAGELQIDAGLLDPERSFSALGLSSVTAISMVGALEEWLGYALSPNIAFECPSIGALSVAAARAREASRTERIARRGVASYPLAHSQSGFYFMHRLAPTSAAYNVGVAVRITSPLSIDRLRGAIGALLGRHAALRTRFGLDAAGAPVQTCRDAVDVELWVEDARGWSDAQLADAVRLDHAEPFDLEQDPMLRSSLFVRSERDAVLLLALPHIVVNFWSLLLLVRDLAAIYSEPDRVLGAAPVSYGDWVEWHRGEVDARSDELARHWLERLSGSPLQLPLPVDRPRRPASGRPGAMHAFVLDAATTRALKRMAADCDASLYALLLAGFQLLLHRYSGEPDLVVGSPVNGRGGRPELADVVGCFINTVVMRSQLRDGDSLRQHLARVRDTVQDALAHQDLPFSRLVERVHPDRDGERSPIIHALFALQTLHLDPIARLFAPRAGARPVELGPLTLEPFMLPQTEAQFDLALEMLELEGELCGVFKYDADLYDPATIERAEGHYRALLDALLTDADQPAATAPLLTADEQARWLEWSGPRHGFTSDCLHQRFERHAAATPEAVALVAGDVELTYAQLDRRANALAHRLVSLGVGPEVLVGVCADRTDALVVALLAVLKAGGAYVPLDPAYPPDRLALILDDAAAPVVITQSRHADRLTGAAAARVLLDDPAIAGAEAAEPPACGARPEHLAYVLYTSGSTGRPKGVCIEHRNAVAFLDFARDILDDVKDGVLASTSICFDLSIFELFGPLSLGGRILLVDTAIDLASFRRAAEVTLVNTVPSAMAQLLRMGGLPSSVRCVCLAGEPLTRALVNGIAATGHVEQVFNLYGPTEGTTYSTVARVPLGSREEPTIGVPVRGTQAYVLDARMQPVPIGVSGELHLGGLGVARGYLRRPQLTDERFVPDPFTPGSERRLYCTGDVVRWRADGQLQYQGRNDHQVKIRGFRIELDEIRLTLEQHPAVQDAVVVADADPQGGLRLVAYVVTAPGCVAPAGALRDHLRARLPAHMADVAFCHLAALPLTPSGKVDRKALPAIGDHERGFVAPRSPEEESIAAAWCEVLGVERVGVHDDFFQLGGHSLLAVQLAARVEQTIGARLSLSALYARPTVEEMAAEVAQAAHADDATPVAPVLVASGADRHLPFPLTDVQRAYWIGRSLTEEMGGAATHVYFEFEGPDIDVARVARAVRQLVFRHDMLRATVTDDGHQVIRPDVPAYEVEVVDLRPLPEHRRQAELESIRDALSRQSLPASRWPLFAVRASLIPEGVRLHIVVDALIADGWSLLQLAREFAALHREEDPQLPELTVSFRDCVVAGLASRAGKSGARARAYWMSLLDRLPPAPELPLAAPATQTGRRSFTRRTERLNAIRWARLRRRAARARITPSVLLLTAYAEVLGRWSVESAFTLNLTIFNRPAWSPGVASVVGDFTSLVPIAFDTGAAGGFEDRARAVNARLWADLEHSAFTGVELLRELARVQGRALGELLPVVFTSLLPLGTARGEAAGFEFPFRHVYGVSQTAQVWLDHQVLEEGGELVFNWDAVEGHFAPGLLDAMFESHRAFLERLADCPDGKELQSVAGPELPARDLAVHQALAAPAMTVPAAALHALFVDQVAQRPDQLALISDGRSLTYGELDALSRDLAGRLVALGVNQDSPVGIAFDKGLEQVVSSLAVLRARGIYLPLDPNLPGQRLAELCAQSGAELVLCSPAAARIGWPERVRLVEIGPELSLPELSPEAAPAALPEVRPGDLAYVIFTSGSTGTPKGVTINHAGAVNTCVAINSLFAVGPEDRVLALSSFSFDLSVWDVFGVLGAGGVVVMPGPSSEPDPARWASLLARHRITVWNSVPGLLEILASYLESIGERAPADLRLTMMSGDWIPVSLPARLRALSDRMELISLGGATEGSIWSIYYPIGDVDASWASIPYGRPLPNQRVDVLDARLERRPVGVPGELYIAGAGVAVGYWRQPALTARAFVTYPRTGERLYRTGDLGRYREDGTIELLGRNDLQVKIRGHRVELGEIEAALLSHPGVRAAAVAAVGDARARRRLAAQVVLSDATDARPSSDQLRDHLRERLPEHMVPSTITAVDRLPMSRNGKIDRTAIAAAERPVAATEHAAPATEMERLVWAVWREVLDNEAVGVEENFFEVGGDSVAMTRIHAMLCRRLGRRVSIVELFGAPTIRRVASALEGQSGPSVEAARQLGAQRRHAMAARQGRRGGAR